MSCSRRWVASSIGRSRTPGRERGDVGLDRGLVLGGRRHDRRGRDLAVLADLVAVEEEAARGLGGPRRDAGPRLPGTAGAPAAT